MKCPYCGRKFATLDAWRAHQDEWNEAPLPPLGHGHASPLTEDDDE